MSIENNTNKLNVLKELIDILPYIPASDGVKMSYGWFRASSVSQVTITHGLGVIPKFICVVRLDSSIQNNSIFTYLYDPYLITNRSGIQGIGVGADGILFYGSATSNSDSINNFEANTNIAILKTNFMGVPFQNKYFWVAFADVIEYDI